MQRLIVALFMMAFMASCDYSTSSNGNIDAAYARETKTTQEHEVHEQHTSADSPAHEDSPATSVKDSTATVPEATEEHHSQH
jgi:hypothetical protein